MADGQIENVSDTAFWVAHYRAVETKRADALFRDPLASVLSGEQGKRIAETMPGRFMTEWVVAIRTCIIDTFIQEAIGEGVDTVVNLGAGLDTRPYRMDLTETLLWIEADYPRMIEYKQRRLSNETPRCKLERVSVDLGKVAEREKLFADIAARGRKVLVLTEGVVPYLSVEDVGSLADELRKMPSINYWILDYLSPIVMRFRERAGITKRTQNAPFKFKPADWFGFFREHGWKMKEMRYLAEEGERLKRAVRLPVMVKVLRTIRMLFVSKEGREAYKKLAGYALLEPVAVGDRR